MAVPLFTVGLCEKTRRQDKPLENVKEHSGMVYGLKIELILKKMITVI